MKRATHLLVVAAVAVVVTACEAAPPPQPPTSATSATMQALASDIGGLQDTLTVSALDAAAVERAIAGLNALSSRAKALQGKGVAAHPLVREGMPSFVQDVEAARAALQRQPPDAEPARMLAQSCRACHALALAPSSSMTTRLAAH